MKRIAQIVSLSVPDNHIAKFKTNLQHFPFALFLPRENTKFRKQNFQIFEYYVGISMATRGTNTQTRTHILTQGLRITDTKLLEHKIFIQNVYIWILTI